jgi:hypothetical protein
MIGQHNGQTNGKGALRRVLDSAVEETGFALKDFTVLAIQHDPYRLDTDAGHRNAAWFAEMVEDLIAPDGTVHLRGLHYRIAARSGILRPDNGLLYTNNDNNWEWLSGKAAKAARWLGYVAFERIVDERNAPPLLFVPEAEIAGIELDSGAGALIPNRAEALPSFIASGFVARQPYQIILFGEKVSLSPVLLPIAQKVGGELLLPTGEASDTMIAELAARAVLDERPSVVLYFSDFDPSGHQMAISVARKLQALYDLHHPSLEIQLHPVALTVGQVRSLNLRSTPLKEEERRADRWRAVMQHEQTEIDALAALNPEALERIAWDALGCFYDETLEARIEEARARWQEQARAQLQRLPAYRRVAREINTRLADLVTANDALQSTQEVAAASLSEIEPPQIILPIAEIASEPPRPLYTTENDFATASRRLFDHKRLLTEATS